MNVLAIGCHPDDYVDISGQIEMKLKALEMRESQIKWMLEHDDIDFVDIVEPAPNTEVISAA